jgi:hypothetical protein
MGKKRSDSVRGTGIEECFGEGYGKRGAEASRNNMLSFTLIMV